MTDLEAMRPLHPGGALCRRDFLRAGALGLVGCSFADRVALEAASAVRSGRDVNCIALMLVGAPSQLDTWDPKPDARREVRGPCGPIPTNVAGIRISEIFPRMARHADKFALLRSVYSSGLATHDAGHQVLQTGRRCRGGLEPPHVGSLVGFLKGPKGEAPPHVLLPRPIGLTGGNMAHGQSGGFLGPAWDPFVPGLGRSDSSAAPTGPLLSSTKAREALDLSREPEAALDRYGRNRFGRSCLRARRLVEAGVRFVTVNMFDTVFHQVTWDTHGSAPFSTLGDYRRVLGPMFDDAYASLIEDLASRGLLDETLVVAMGEFGRTPTINADGGRDHWTGCWTVAMAGGGVKGGQVVGASDEIGAWPKDRPIPVESVPATMMHALGIDLDTEVPGPDGRPFRVVEPGVDPVMELF